MNDKIANAFESADNFYINYYFNNQGFIVSPTERDCSYDYVLTDKNNDNNKYIAEVKFRSFSPSKKEPLYINKKKIKKLKKIQQEEEIPVVFVNAFPKDNKLIIHKLDDIDANNTIERKVFNPSFNCTMTEEQVLVNYNDKNIRDFNMQYYQYAVRQALILEGVPKNKKEEIMKKWS